jgi:gliding motility-associated-like protein
MRFSAIILLFLISFLSNQAQGQVNDDFSTTSEDNPVAFSVTANDTDPDGIDEATVDLDPLTVTQESTITTGEGTFQVDASGQLTFTPILNFSGDAAIQYSVKNDLGTEVGTSTITITVTPVNDPPVAGNDGGTTPQNTPVSINVITNDSDVDGSVEGSSVDLNLLLPGQQISLNTLAGTFELISPGVVQFTPVLIFTGQASASYRVNDSDGGTSNAATITIDVIPNSNPVAANDSEVTSENTPVDVPVLTNDTDDGTIDEGSVDLNPALLLRQTSIAVTGGTFTVNTSGVVTFTPTSGYNGDAIASYTVDDTQGGKSNTASITVTVTPVNANPVANDDVANTDENEAISISVLTNDTDDVGLDNTSIDLNPAVAGQQTNVTVTGGTFANGPAGSVVFTPDTNFNGTATTTYTVDDNENATSNSASITVMVNSVNAAPTAADDAAATNEDTPVGIKIIDNDTDDTGIATSTVDLAPGTPGQQLTRSVSGGDFSYSADELTFTPTTNFNGTATVTYTVEDIEGAMSNIATVTITVNSVNANPVANNDTGTTNENDDVSINVLSNDTDDIGLAANTVDLDPATAGTQTSRSVTGGVFTVSAGTVSFTPTTNFNGTATVSYTVNDTEGATSNIATITITVNSVNPPPVANNDTGTTNENTAVNVTILANDTDDTGFVTSSVDLDQSTAGKQTSRTVTGGTFTVNASGVLSFSPTTNFNGTSSVTYTVEDTEGATSNAATVTITVNSVNANPVANNDTGTTNENDLLTISILANDTDDIGLAPASVDLDPVTVGIQNSRAVTGGTYNVNSAGVLSFTPTTNFNGTSSITYTVQDTEGATSNIATVTVTVNSVNAAPVAVNDATTTNENEGIDIAVLANDTDDIGIVANTVDLDPGTPGRQTSRTVTGGTFIVNTAGLVSFTPTTNFNGSASVTYTVNDAEGATSNIATVTVIVSSVNASPVAVNDAATTDENTPVTVSVLANDSDDIALVSSTVDLNTSIAGTQTSRTVAGGAFTVNASGIVTFTPATNVNGVSSITYTVSDGEGATSNAATITVTVNSVNANPVAVNDAGVTDENAPVNISVLANDTDDTGVNAATVDLDPATPGIQMTKTVTGGAFTVNTAGIVTFTPSTNFNGTSTVTYTVNDVEGATSNAATVTITINSVNTPPSAVNDTGATDEEMVVTISILANDSDDGTIDATSVDIDQATGGIQNTVTLASGVFSVNASGVLSYTPAANFNGAATVTYTVNDTEGEVSNVATVSINVNPLNDAPVAVSDAIVTNEDVQASVNILTNDSDADGSLDGNTVDINVTTPGQQTTRVTAAGTFSVNSSGLLTFTPAANYNGTSAIRYTVADNQGTNSNMATITVTVNAINDAPVAVPDNATTDQGVAVTINVLTNDSDDNLLNTGSVDLNPDVSGIQASRSISSGNFNVSSSGVVTFSPHANFSGSTSIEYTVNDNEGVSSNRAVISVVVNFVNQKPVAANDGAVTDEDVAVAINVIANDTDEGSINPGTVDLNTAVAGIQTSNTTAQGSWTVNASGVVTFTPTLNFNGAASMTYSVNDNLGETSNTATISVTVTPVNDAPVAVADAKTTNEDNATTITILANDTDADNSVLASSVDLDPATTGSQTSVDHAEGNWSVNAAGVVTFTPIANFFGTATNTYTVNDNIGATSNIATITVTVNAVNDVPIAVNDQASTPQNQQVSFNVTANDLDVDGTINVGTVDLDPAVNGRQTSKTIVSGTFTVDNAGNVTFVPVTNFNGSSGIQYTVQDNLSGVSSPGSITVLVNFVNTAPVANDDNIQTNEDTPSTFAILTNDTDDGTIAASTVDLNPTVGGIQNTVSTASGKFDVNASGMVTFTPALNFSGVASVNYTVNDNIGATSNMALITVTVNAVNDSPIAVNDNANTNEDVAVNINILSNDSDIDGTLDLASIDLNTATPAIDNTATTVQGTFSVVTSGSGKAVSFTPLANFNGTATLSYTVNDNLGLKSNVATISVTVANVNDAPAFDVIPSQVVLRNSAIKSVPITGISPGQGESEQVLLSAQSDNTPVVPNPTIAYGGSGSTATLSFKPQANQFGDVTVTVKAVDNGLTEFTRTFMIKVVDARITSTPVLTAVKGEQYQYSLSTTAFDPLLIDPTLTFVASQIPAWASLSSTGKNTALLSGIPPLNAALTNPITIQLRDGATVIDEQKFTLKINQRPVVAAFDIETSEDNGLPLPIDRFVEAFTDPDDDGISEIVITQLPDPAKGVLLLNGTPVIQNESIPIALISNVVYMPATNSFGSDSFSYLAGDGNNLSSDAAVVNITVLSVNDAPEITAIETEPLPFDIGLELAQIFTPGIEIRDVDSDELSRVEIGFKRPNFDDLHDVLEFGNTSKIKGNYDESAGILTLSGKASVDEYITAIRSVEYNFIDIETVDNLRSLRDDPRTVYIRISDGVAESVEKERVIDLRYSHIPLVIPNAFTPESRINANTVWRIREKDHSENILTQYPDAVVTVFNKRGQIVYSAIGLEKEWDGTRNGQPLPADTYFYVIDLHYGGIVYKGSVTIFKEVQ